MMEMSFENLLSFFWMFSQAALRIAKGIQTMFIKSGQDQPLSHAMVKGQF